MKSGRVAGVVKKKVVREFFFFQAEDGIRDYKVTGVQTCALPISVKESIGFIKKEHKKFVLGQIEPFVYQRWLFAREALEVFFIDELKHYTTITEQEAEAKHREYLKKKNAHFQEIYKEMKKENEEESDETNEPKSEKMDALVVNRRTKSLRVLAQKNQESNDQEMFNWLHV